MLRAEGIDPKTGIQKVGYLKHQLARFAPGFFGDSEFMESESPKWLEKLTTITADKTENALQSKDKKTGGHHQSSVHTESEIDTRESWLDLLRDKLGL